jgi:translation initiation factor IF-3
MKANELADQFEQDLVEVAPTAKPPVCRIMDFAKYKYEQEKKERKARKNAHIVHLKQIRLKPHIDDHDFETKLNQARGFLEKKDKVRVNLFFSGREMAFREKAKGLLVKFVAGTADLSTIEKDIFMEGRVMSVLFTPRAEKVAAPEKPAVSEKIVAPQKVATPEKIATPEKPAA